MSQQLDLSLRLCGQWRYTTYTLRAFITATMSNFYSILCHRRGSRPGRGTRSRNNNTSTLRRVLHADEYTLSTCFNRWGVPRWLYHWALPPVFLGLPAECFIFSWNKWQSNFHSFHSALASESAGLPSAISEKYQTATVLNLKRAI